MTVVAGLVDATSNSAIIVADSRVTARDGGAHFDICQKVAWLDNQGVFGFAGPTEVAASISRWITGTYKKRGVGWLNSESEVLGFLSHIGALGQPDPNEFLVAFMDDAEASNPRATIVRFSTDGVYARTRLGLEIIGSGSETYDAIRPMLTDLISFAGLGRTGAALAQRALFLSEVVVTEAKAQSIESVGGLMQVHLIEKAGIRAVPYERWVDIDEAHGTYVTMDIDAVGAWVQVHGPSGLTVPLRFPGEPDFGLASGTKATNFELESLLTTESPGVQPTPNPVLAYKGFSNESGEWLVRTPATST